ncbi:MAG: hypothetical protein KF774_02265 [Planctomyces sp.]|nr:hypothetical protein [Planctomyces sp.]
MYDFFSNLDRRWIFLAMGLAVAIPVLFQLQFPESSSALSEACFTAIEELPPGSRVLLAFDFDPASKGELEPMATSFVRHCCEKKHKLYFMTLWPVGVQMIDNAIDRVIRADFPEMVYGEDYVNLGYKPGYEGVIKVVVSDLKKLYSTDSRGTNIDQIPMCRNLKNILSMRLIVNVSAGFPGAKEWIQYAATPYKELSIVAGCTGVQAALLYPYVPDQLPGLLGAIKGAAEYEQLVNAAYTPADATPVAKYLEAKRRMGPQFVAHLLMIFLIILGNTVYFLQRAQARRRG